MADVATILRDPNFHALPIEERRKVLAAIDPNFGSLPTIEQDKVFLATASAPIKPGPTPVSIPLRNSEGLMTPKGLDSPLGTTAKTLLAPLDFIKASAEQAGEGYTHVISPQSGDDFAHGLAKSAKGTAGMLLPMAAPTMAAHPLLTLLGLGVGGGVGAGTEALANYAGVPQGYSELAGTGAGILAGGGAVRGANALSNTLSSPGIPIREPVMRFWNALQENRNNPATQDAVIGQLPYVGPKFRAINASFPKPPEAVAPKPAEPFRPNPATKAKMKYAPAPQEAGPSRSSGNRIPRAIPKPLEVVEPVPVTPEPYKFKPSSTTASRMKFTPAPQEAGPSTGTGNIIPRGRFMPKPPEEIPVVEPKAPEPFKPNPNIAKKMRFTPSGGGAGMPSSRPNYVKAKRLPPPPAEGGEGAVTETPEGIILTPAMKEAIAKGVMAERSGFQPTQIPVPPRTGPFSVKPGEGTHLDMSHVKPGEVPTKADYQTGARNLWAGHMSRVLQGKTVADVEKMTLEDLTVEAKKAGLGAASPDKIKVLIERLKRP